MKSKTQKRKHLNCDFFWVKVPSYVLVSFNYNSNNLTYPYAYFCDMTARFLFADLTPIIRSLRWEVLFATGTIKYQGCIHIDLLNNHGNSYLASGQNGGKSIFVWFLWYLLHWQTIFQVSFIEFNFINYFLRQTTCIIN